MRNDRPQRPDAGMLAVVLVAAVGVFACSDDSSGGNAAGSAAAAGSAGFAGVGGAAAVGGATAAVGGGTAGVVGGVGGAVGGVGGAVGGASGAVGGAGGATGAPTFSAIFTELLTSSATGNCMAGFCHGAAPSSVTNGNLQILATDKATTYANIVGVVSTSDMCPGVTIVAPGDSANSLLIQKFAETPPCGMRMPIGPPLTEAQVAQIAAWIDMGAPNN